MSETSSDRMRRLLAPASASPAGSPVAPKGDGLLRIPLACTVHRRSSVVVAEERKGKVRFLRNEPVPSGPGGGVGAASLPAVLGAFEFDFNGSSQWPGCQWCGTRQNTPHNFGLFWSCCGCQSAGRPAFNCASADSSGEFRCPSCGSLCGTFTIVDKHEVRGDRDVAAASAPRMPPPSVAAVQPIPAATGLLRPSPSFTPPPVPTVGAPRPADMPPSLRLRWQK
jgi:hypothetical protein